MSSDDHEEEGVGYKRPPRHSQFKKGKSGNPRGRPRGSVMRAAVEKVLDRKVLATVDGLPRRVPLTEAVALQMAQKALKGDLAAAKELMRVAEMIEQARASEKTAIKPTTIVLHSISPRDCNPVLEALGVIVEVDGCFKVAPWVAEAARARGAVLKREDEALLANCMLKVTDVASQVLVPREEYFKRQRAREG